MRRMCLSDLHLGDNRSILSDARNARSLVDALVRKIQERDGLASTTRPTLATLVLCGDIWEECVPSDFVYIDHVFSRSVREASRTFFGYLLDQVSIDQLVWVPGNHDLCLWQLCSQSDGSGLVTTGDGVGLSSSESPAYLALRTLLGGVVRLDQIRVAYPIFRDASAGSDYPMLLFTHGHLMDPLVRGLGSDAAYAALAALGCRRPGSLEDAQSLRRVADLTDPFTLALWRRYSRRDYLYSNYVMRRLEHPQSCGMHPTAKSSLVGPIRESFDQPLPGCGLVGEVPWFLQMAIMDPELPTPVGSLRPTNQAPAFERPSCLVHGHDHLGTSRTIVSCGVPFRVVDAGGWTSEFAGHVPHSHVLAWQNDELYPTSHYFDAPYPI